MLRRGQLDVIHPGVARLAGTPRTYVQRIAAAVWSAGGSAMASHRSAMHLFGVDASPTESTPVDLIVPGRSRKLSLAGVVAHRPTDHERLTPQRRSGVRCSGLLRSLVDLGAVAPDDVHGALGHVLSTKEVGLDAIAAVLRDHGRQGRAGVGALRVAFESWAIDGKPADSVLESAFVRLVDRHELPPFEFHPRIEGWEVDFRFLGTNVVVECDGWTTHGLDQARFERDRRRDDDLSAAGWSVHRFTYRAITTAPADTARRIKRAIDRSRPR